MKRIFLSLAAVMALLLTGCKESPSLNITPEVFTCPEEGGTLTAVLTANSTWSATAVNNVTVSPSKGTGDSPISFTVSPNLDGTPREMTVLFTCEKGGSITEKSVLISQLPVGPYLNVTPQDTDISSEGGTVTFELEANYDWSATTEDQALTITPGSGAAGKATVAVTVTPNTTGAEINHVMLFACESKTEFMKFNVTIFQPAENPSITITPSSATVNFEANTIEVELESNYGWTAIPDNSGVAVNPTSGEKGTSTVSVSVPFNNTTSPVTYSVEFKCVNGDASKSEHLTITQEPASILTYGGVDYKIKWLADGNLWMCENLRFVPEGITPSDDPTVEAGMWYPNALSSEAKTSPEDIAKYGYLYSTPVAFGVAEINAENYNTFEGCQGICPDGWHIPSLAECQGLIDAYYDETQKGALFAVLAEAGFSSDLGGFRMKNTSILTGSYSPAMPGYILSSTANQYKVNETTGAITSQNKAILKTDNKTYQRYTIANTSNYGGCSIRCIKNK